MSGQSSRSCGAPTRSAWSSSPALRRLDAFLPSAGGPYRLPGDYVYSNQRLPYSQSGQWGYLRVLPAGDQRLLPLAGAGAGMKSASFDNATQVIPVAAK